MSRAPAPMPMNTPSVADTPMVSPYTMSTYGMAGPMHGGGMMAPNTNSPLHAMQNMYGNMQMQSQMQTQPQVMYAPQHLASPAYMHGMQPSTTQNVAVVDFKPDTLINTQIAQLHQQYQNQINSLTATPSLGLIGRDGQYIPATAAVAHPLMGHEPYAPNVTGNSRGYVDDPHSSYPRNVGHNASMDHAAIASSIEDLVEASVERRIAASPLAKPSSSYGPDAVKVGGAFHNKPLHEQRQIVGDAVKSVMDKHNAKIDVGAGYSQTSSFDRARSRYSDY
jgi:hypothetical protein